LSEGTRQVPFCGKVLNFSDDMDKSISNHFEQPSKFVRIVYLWCIVMPYHPYPAQKGTKLTVSNLIIKGSLNRSQELHSTVFTLVKLVDSFIELVNDLDAQGKLDENADLLSDQDKLKIGKLIEQVTTGINHLIFVACVREWHKENPESNEPINDILFQKYTRFMNMLDKNKLTADSPIYKNTYSLK